VNIIAFYFVIQASAAVLVGSEFDSRPSLTSLTDARCKEAAGMSVKSVARALLAFVLDCSLSDYTVGREG